MNRNIRILERVLEKLIEEKDGARERYSLCYTAKFNLGKGDYYFFDRYMHKHLIKGRKVFYRIDGQRTDNNGWYVWRANNKQARINWLEKMIENEYRFYQKSREVH